jgi:hypothetical protein
LTAIIRSADGSNANDVTEDRSAIGHRLDNITNWLDHAVGLRIGLVLGPIFWFDRLDRL